MNRSIQVFEHGSLKVGQQGFKRHHFDRLVQYNEREGNRLFTIGHERIRFKQYVGVLQVGSLAIEILPKADRREADEPIRWQRALVEMLRQCGFLRLSHTTAAHVRRSPVPLIDLFFESFLNEAACLVRRGLKRQYHKVEGNTPALKGRIVFSRHIHENLIHKERFYTSRSNYDKNVLLNRIIKRALEIVSVTGSNQRLHGSARELLFAFEDVMSVPTCSLEFERIHYDRNNEHYRHAIRLAKLIILNHAPDVSAGWHDMLAILFDMNLLFERFVYVQLKRAENFRSDIGLGISAQIRKGFWGRKTVRPDIVVEHESEKGVHRLIIDTKWKIPAFGQPDVADLRQMYVYNIHFGATTSVLVYPGFGELKPYREYFKPSKALGDDYRHDCRLYFVDLFDGEGNIKKDIGASMIGHLIDGTG